jgi:hypothetical protein
MLSELVVGNQSIVACGHVERDGPKPFVEQISIRSLMSSLLEIELIEELGIGRNPFFCEVSFSERCPKLGIVGNRPKRLQKVSDRIHSVYQSDTVRLTNSRAGVDLQRTSRAARYNASLGKTYRLHCAGEISVRLTTSRMAKITIVAWSRDGIGIFSLACTAVIRLMLMTFTTFNSAGSR